MRTVTVTSTYKWSHERTHVSDEGRRVEEVTDEVLGEVLGEHITQLREETVGQFDLADFVIHVAVTNER